MQEMFTGCKKLKKIKGLNYFITTEAENMYSMFESCSELEYLDLSNFDTSYVINMQGMFRDCIKLREIIGLKNFNTNEVENMSRMFLIAQN